MNVFIHTGLGKCASTFMQEVFFPYLEKEKKIRIYKFFEDESIELPCFNRKMQTNDKEIIESTDQAIEKLKKESLYTKDIDIDNTVNNLQKLNNLKKFFLERDVFEKGNSDNILIDCKQLTWDNYKCIDHKKMFLDGALILKKIIPDVKIIFIIRHQIDLLISEYRSSIHQRYMQDFDSFILNSEEIEQIKRKKLSKDSSHQKEKSEETKWIYPIGYDFAYMIENYYKIFGKNNCLILFAENLKDPKKKQEEYIKIIKFFGVEETDATETAKNFTNHIDNINTFKINANISYVDEVVYFTFIFEKFLKYFGIKIPYAYVNKNPIKSNFFLIKSLNKIIKIILFHKYISWLKIREVLQNQNHIITKIIKIIFRGKRSFLKDELTKTKRKFNNLDGYFDQLNQRLPSLFDEAEIPKNFINKLNG